MCVSVLCGRGWGGGAKIPWLGQLVALEACTYDRKPDRLQIKRDSFFSLL